MKDTMISSTPDLVTLKVRLTTSLRWAFNHRNLPSVRRLIPHTIRSIRQIAGIIELRQS